jgi:hypothetical protein
MPGCGAHSSCRSGKAKGFNRSGTFEPLPAGHRQSGASVAKEINPLQSESFEVSLS